MHVKDQVLGNIFGGNLSLPPHCQDSLQSTSYQIRDFLPSSWGYLLTLWLEICVPNDKLGFSGDNCKSLTFCEILLAQIWKILSPNKWRKIFFISCERHCDQWLIVVLIYYFQIWNKKEHNIIISIVISSHMGPMYIETPKI